MVDGVNTLATRPESLCRRTRLPSLTAIPAASCPRCCNANRAKKTVWATPSPCGVDTPNTPHSSRGESERISCADLTTTGWSGSMPDDLLDPVGDRVAAGLELQAGQS